MLHALISKHTKHDNREHQNGDNVNLFVFMLNENQNNIKNNIKKMERKKQLGKIIIDRIHNNIIHAK